MESWATGAALLIGGLVAAYVIVVLL